MSPTVYRINIDAISVPRASGDEPPGVHIHLTQI